MHPRLSVHTVGFGARPVRELVDSLVAQGIRRIGVPVTQLERGGLRANAAALRSAGIEVLDVVLPTAFTLAEPVHWPGERARLRGCVEVTAAVGARLLYLTTGPAGPLTWDEAAARFAAAVAPVLADARAAGVTLAVENTTPLRADLGFVHRLTDVIDAAALAGIAVCADLFAAWTDRDLRAAIAAGVEESGSGLFGSGLSGSGESGVGQFGAGQSGSGLFGSGLSGSGESGAGQFRAGQLGAGSFEAGRFALVQVADFVLGTLQTPDRAVPGDGDIPIQRQLRWLAEAGYTGPIEVELLGPRITAEGPAQAAARAVRILSSWL
jgi:sugar phosphate isomerase/epimerase